MRTPFDTNSCNCPYEHRREFRGCQRHNGHEICAPVTPHRNRLGWHLITWGILQNAISPLSDSRPRFVPRFVPKFVSRFVPRFMNLALTAEVAKPLQLYESHRGIMGVNRLL
jgi:hypothetical protein